MVKDEFIALDRGLLKHPSAIIPWRRLTAAPGADASAIHGRLGARVALLQSPILPATWVLYPEKEIFRNLPVDKPHTRNPQEPLPDGTGQKIFYQAVARAGLPDKGGIHCLRHSFATHWMEAGLPLFVLKRLLGHTSLSTTSKYLHVSREHLAKIKSPLDESVDPAPPAAPPSVAPSPKPYPAGCPSELAGVVSPFDQLPTH